MDFFMTAVVLACWLTNPVGNTKISILPLGPTIGEDNKTIKPKAKLCQLPPYPKHGGYVVLNETKARPGDAFDSVSLVQYTTVRSDKVFEIKRLTCKSGQWYQDLIEYESDALHFYTSWCPHFCSSFLSEQWTECSTPNSGDRLGNYGAKFTRKQRDPNVTKLPSCRLPPYPSRGTYVVQDTPDAGPGDSFQNVSLIQYTSDERNEVITIKQFRCSSGAWYQKIFQEASESLKFHSSWCPNLCSECFGKKLTEVSHSALSQNQGSRKKGQSQTTTSSCVLPPHPKFGNYSLISETGVAQPGDEFDAFRLNYTCGSGYRLVGNRNVYCLKGVWSGHLPKCTKYCHLIRQPGVEYSCKKAGLGADIGPCGAHVEENSKVTVRCLSPYYQSKSRLKPMSCENGKWKNVPDCKPVCGLRTQADEHPSADTRLRAPWHVGIFLKLEHPFTHTCGGSIVASNLVISAATCFPLHNLESPPTAHFLVIAGKLYRSRYQPNDDKTQEREVESIKLPELYTGYSTNFQHDIALVFLYRPFSFNEYVWPICVDFDKEFDKTQLAEGRSGIVAGWGPRDGVMDKQATTLLQAVELPNVGIERCVRETLNVETKFSTLNRHIASDMICAGYNNSTPLCNEYNGEGFAVPETDPLDPWKRYYYLRGIVSMYNKILCKKSHFSILVKVSAHENFIKNNVAGAIY